MGHINQSERKVAALYVESDGPYMGHAFIDAWDKARDARLYPGPHPVIAHPPCERWGRYWGGGPMLHGTPNQKLLGDDGGCFAHALWAVRTYGGVLEHPEASHAFKYYGLPIPRQAGGWSSPDSYGGRSCCVSQGKYGHKTQKLTWLYAVSGSYPELDWGRSPGMMRMDQGLRSKERSALAGKKLHTLISKKERLITPAKFKNVLIKIAQGGI